MGNAAIDYEKQDALNSARMQPPKAEDFQRLPANGRSNNYLQDSSADNYANESENDKHAGNLDKARAGTKSNELKNAENLAMDASKLATPMGAVSLMSHIRPIADIPYFAAIGVAILKDLSDLVLIGSLPGLGSAITVCASIFIFMMMLLVGGGAKQKIANSLMKKGGIQIGATIIEVVMPGINFVPIMTATVIAVYIMTLSERKHAEQ